MLYTVARSLVPRHTMPYISLAQLYMQMGYQLDNYIAYAFEENTISRNRRLQHLVMSGYIAYYIHTLFI